MNEYCAHKNMPNSVKQDLGGANQSSYGIAETNFTKPHTKVFRELGMYEIYLKLDNA